MFPIYRDRVFGMARELARKWSNKRCTVTTHEVETKMGEGEARSADSPAPLDSPGVAHRGLDRWALAVADEDLAGERDGATCGQLC